MREKGKVGTRGALNRRDLLKAAVVAPTAALVQVAPAAAVAPSAPTAAYAPKIFTAHHWKTLQALCDLTIPADSRSGSATQAKVPEFIDDWLTLEPNAGGLKTEVLGGLTWIDVECHRLFGYDLADCREAQQKQVLDRIAYLDKASPRDRNAAAAFNLIRGLVLDGFFTSKMGVEDLRYEGNKMLSSWNGCPPSAAAQLGVSYSEWEHRYQAATTSANPEKL